MTKEKNYQLSSINDQFMKTTLLLTFALLLIGGAVNSAMAQNDINQDGFHDGDVAVINAIIQNNGLKGYEVDAPRTWDFANWGNGYPLRVIKLNLDKKSLTGALDVAGLTGLTELRCSENQLTKLNVAGLTGLTELYCYTNQLTELDVAGLTGLTSLDCTYNQLTELDISRLTGLTMLGCGSNQLTELDVSRLTGLTMLGCGYNPLTELNVSRLTSLTLLSCSSNQLTELDVSRLTNLTELACGDNPLTELDVSRLTNLTELYCNVTQLTKLDVSRLTGLTKLYCAVTQLTELDVAGLTNLTTLYCYSNQLTELDVSGLTNLTDLWCYNNQLTKLNISGLTRLTDLRCTTNPLTTLVAPNGKTLTVSASPAEGGRAVITGISGNNNSNSCSIHLEVTTNANSTFTGWTSTPSVAFGATAAHIAFFDMPDTDIAVTANFETGDFLSVFPASLSFAAKGEWKVFAITSNTSWTVESDAEWLTVSPASGQGNAPVDVIVGTNKTGIDRTATITVRGTNVDAKTINVTHPALRFIPKESQTINERGLGKIRLDYYVPIDRLRGRLNIRFPQNIVLDEEQTVLSPELAENADLLLTPPKQQLVAHRDQAERIAQRRACPKQPYHGHRLQGRQRCAAGKLRGKDNPA
jgi:Leucine-rich repeat (LRR) protein